jgi:hypothetical protein
MRIAYLQRLRDPEAHPLLPFGAFGLRDGVLGGFGPRFYQALTRVLSLEYMGDAAYEWGAVPESYKRVLMGVIEDTYGVHRPHPLLWALCRQEQLPDIQVWCKRALASPDEGELRLHEKSGIWRACHETSLTRGWHDIDNDFFLFTTSELARSLLAFLQEQAGLPASEREVIS